MNNNGDQASNTAGTGTVSATVTEPIPSTASATVTPPTMVVPTTLPEGTVSSLIPQSHLVTPRLIMTSDYRPFSTNFTMAVLGREQR